MLRWQLETQRACEALDWLVVETRGDDEAAWGCHLLCRGDAEWGRLLFRHAWCEPHDGRARDLIDLARTMIRAPLGEAEARLLFLAAPEPRLEELPVPEGEEAAPYFGSLAWWPGPGFLLADAGNEVLVWDLAGKELVARHAHDAICRDGSPYFQLAIDPETRVLATGDRIREFALWSLDSFEKLNVFAGHGEEVQGAAFFEGDRILSISGDSTARLWDRRTAACLATLDTHPLYCLARHPVDPVVAVGGSGGGAGRVYLIDADCALVRVIETPVAPAAYAPLPADRARRIGIVASRRDSATIACIAWHPDGRHVVTGGWDYVVKMFDRRTGACVRRWIGHSHWVTAIAVSPDGARIASGGSDGQIRIWAADSDRCLAELDRLPSSVEDLRFVAGRLHAACFDGRVYMLP